MKKIIKSSQKADCFVNLRNTNDQNNQNNFPSKLLQYLPYCVFNYKHKINNVEKN